MVVSNPKWLLGVVNASIPGKFDRIFDSVDEAEAFMRASVRLPDSDPRFGILRAAAEASDEPCEGNPVIRFLAIPVGRTKNQKLKSMPLYRLKSKRTCALKRCKGGRPCVVVSIGGRHTCTCP